MFKLMRYNDFKNDPLSQCSVYNLSCSPSFSAALAIASRNDLNDPNGKYSISELGDHGFGAIDSKLKSSEMVKNLEMLAVSGPTSEQQLPFEWSTTNLKALRQEGHPNLFNFKPIYTKLFPNNYVNATVIK
jgi:hypothetical protein